MAKKYNSAWDAKRLVVNFSQKQWRQDFAAFVRTKKFWDFTRVTRARAVSNNPLDRGIKSFEVYNRYGGNVTVTFQDENKIVSSSNLELVEEYLSERGM